MASIFTASAICFAVCSFSHLYRINSGTRCCEIDIQRCLSQASHQLTSLTLCDTLAKLIKQCLSFCKRKCPTTWITARRGIDCNPNWTRSFILSDPLWKDHQGKRAQHLPPFLLPRSASVNLSLDIQMQIQNGISICSPLAFHPSLEHSSPT